MNEHVIALVGSTGSAEVQRRDKGSGEVLAIDLELWLGHHLELLVTPTGQASAILHQVSGDGGSSYETTEVTEFRLGSLDSLIERAQALQASIRPLGSTGVRGAFRFVDPKDNPRP